MVSEAEEISHEDRCEDALDTYEDMVKRTSMGNSLIPRAIKFYKENKTWRGERKIIYTPGTLLDALNEGWTFDPWLNPMGRPIHIGDIDYKGTVASIDPKPTLSVYWILVKGTPEQIAGMDPVAELPEDEIDDGPEDVMEPYGLKTMFIPYTSEEKAPDGYVVMHKDHIFAKGTVYTLPPGGVPITAWTVAKDLSHLSSHLGVDEAHDVITGILKKNA